MKPALMAFLLVSVPTAAWACMNTMVIDLATRPLDFAHIGIVVAAVVLLRWRGQSKREMRHAWEEPHDPEYTGPSLTRELTILIVATIAAMGIGLFEADVVDLEYGPISRQAVTNFGFVVAAVLLSHVRAFGSLWVWLRRLTLVVVIVSSAGVGADVLSGSQEVNAWDYLTEQQVQSGVTF